MRWELSEVAITGKVANICKPHLTCRKKKKKWAKLAIRLANAAVLPMVLKSAIELKVIDIISTSGDGVFLSPWEIESRLPTKNPDAPLMLDRMLRLLLSYDVLKCCVKRGDNGQFERAYAAAPVCKFLVQKSESGWKVCWSFVLAAPRQGLDRELISGYHILEGGIPFNGAFDYYGRDERLEGGIPFNGAFEGLKAVVDVGGGIGISLDIKDINFDLLHVRDDAPSYPGVEHVGGDMFQSVPKGGDAIFMKNCWEALPNSGKLIIVEFILPETPENSLSSKITCDLDLFMLAILGEGQERNLKEFEVLAVKSGFSGCEVICTAYNSWVIEFKKIVD
ncbi:hypothetical protein Patl1_08349 [Pistacia atlantica]|uniref:Uncharacterized protein n=1 Tax=Pistacia atlantica TaxID=434234 RepID=A0ACC1AL59_9ROSI|nr:hypothetical protein Patl1_08349 [Pistacia atlantica]